MNDFENDLGALLPKAPQTEEATVIYQCGYAAGVLAGEKLAGEKLAVERQSTLMGWWRIGNSPATIGVALASACLTAVVAWPAGYRMGNVAKMPAEALAMNATTVEPIVEPDREPQQPGSIAGPASASPINASPDNASPDNGSSVDVDNEAHLRVIASVNNPFADLTTVMKHYVYGDLQRKSRFGRTTEYLTSRTVQGWARPFVPINGMPSTMMSTSTSHHAPPSAMEADTQSRPAEDLDATISRPTRANPDAWLNWIQ